MEASGCARPLPAEDAGSRGSPGPRDPRRRRRRCSPSARSGRRCFTAAQPSSPIATRARWRPPATGRRSASSAPPTSATAEPSGVRRRDAALAAGHAPHGVGAGARGYPRGADHRQYGRALHRQGEVDGVMVGADRIAANGDTANKIGTYTLSVLAKARRAVLRGRPPSTVDLAVAGGADIPIEERDPAEVTHFRGARVAPAGVGARHPAFDVTPQANISAIITESACCARRYDKALRLACLKGESPCERRRRAPKRTSWRPAGYASGAAHRPHRQAHGAHRQPPGHGTHSAPAGAPRRDRGLHQPAPLRRRHPGLLRRRRAPSACTCTTASKRSSWARPAARAGFATCSATPPSSW